jgi:ParB family transcriptional regulator, chromosome partitioning protein
MTDMNLEGAAEELVIARNEGRLVVNIPLDAIESDHMVRDRVALNEEDMATLEASILTRGQQTPIEVIEIAPGRYGLISGWRRLSAIRSLAQRDQGPSSVLALIRNPETAADAYISMVEENEIRVGLSYFERANIVARTVREGIFRTEKEALNELFASASRAKRSKIKSFLPIVEAIGAWVRHPTSLTERIGLSVSARLQIDPAWGKALSESLRKSRPASVEDETALIVNALKEGEDNQENDNKTSEFDIEHPNLKIKVKRSKGTMQLSGPDVTDDLLDAVQKFIQNWNG